MAVDSIERAATPGDVAVREFKARLRGDLLRPGDPGYDVARAVHNAMIDRRPALIARCAGVADVIAAVQFAREHRVPLAVRGGGHNVAGFAVCDGGLTVDLSRMRAVRVDPSRRTASAQGGATWGDLDHETQAFGLAVTGGVNRPTGIAGLTLGGGHGHLMRAFGLACDNLLAADVVTAEGRLVTVSASAEPDLFWGLRGGGGNFGVVTSFEYQLHPLGAVLGGLLVYPLAHARDVLRRYRDLMSSAPDALSVSAALRTLPDGTRVAALIVCHIGPIADGERLLAPLRASAPLLADDVAPKPYVAVQSFAETVNPAGRRNYWKSEFLKALSDEAIDVLVDSYASAQGPGSMVWLETMGGAVSRVAEDATAVSHRSAPYDVLILGIWDDPQQDAQPIGWVRGVWNALQPFSFGGVYVNYMSNEGQDRIRAAYGAKYPRLVALKDRFDPTNLFRMNQNIRPTARAGPQAD